MSSAEKTILTKVVGVTFDMRQLHITMLEDGQMLYWEHEPDNKYDSNCINVFADSAKKYQIGNLSRELAKEFVERMDLYTQRIYVNQVTGGEDGKSLGVNIAIKITL